MQYTFCCRWLQSCSLLMASIISFCSILCTTGYRLRWNVNGKAVTSARKNKNLHTHHKSNTAGTDNRPDKVNRCSSIWRIQYGQHIVNCTRKLFDRNLKISLSVYQACGLHHSMYPIWLLMRPEWRSDAQHGDRCPLPCATANEKKDVHAALRLQWKWLTTITWRNLPSVSRGCSAVFCRADKKDNMFVVCAV